jgi:hypothetical protein
MKRPLASALAVAAVLFSVSLPVLADGPSALLFAYFGGGIFVITQFWIVVSEFTYIAFLLRGIGKVKLLWWTVLINMASALVGIIPTILFYFFLLVEDTVPYKRLMIFVLVTYPLSVVVEGWLLYLLARHIKKLEMRYFIKHSFGFNAVSYAGLLGFLAWEQFWRG